MMNDEAEPAAVLDPHKADAVLDLHLSAQTAAAIRRECIENLDIPADRVAAYSQNALARIRAAAGGDATEDRGRIRLRLADLYKRALQVDDLRLAGTILQQMTRLEAPPPPAVGETPDDDAGPADGSAASDVGAIVAALQAHIEPLGLAGDPDATYPDLIAAAAAEIAHHRKAARAAHRKPAKARKPAQAAKPPAKPQARRAARKARVKKTNTK